MPREERTSRCAPSPECYSGRFSPSAGQQLSRVRIRVRNYLGRRNLISVALLTLWRLVTALPLRAYTRTSSASTRVRDGRVGVSAAFTYHWHLRETTLTSTPTEHHWKSRNWGKTQNQGVVSAGDVSTSVNGLLISQYQSAIPKIKAILTGFVHLWIKLLLFLDYQKCMYRQSQKIYMHSTNRDVSKNIKFQIIVYVLYCLSVKVRNIFRKLHYLSNSLMRKHCYK